MLTEFRFEDIKIGEEFLIRKSLFKKINAIKAECIEPDGSKTYFKEELIDLPKGKIVIAI